MELIEGGALASTVQVRSSITSNKCMQKKNTNADFRTKFLLHCVNTPCSWIIGTFLGLWSDKNVVRV